MTASRMDNAMSTVTRRVVVVSPNNVQVETAAIPQINAHEVLVRTTVSGICGSDTHAVQGVHPNITLPYYPGHEVVGIVESVGGAVENVSMGQRVTVEPTLVCGQCKQCLAGRENLCENLKFFGCGHSQGGMADYFSIPANRLHVVPEAFSMAQAALIEPLATPVHAVRLASCSGRLDGRTVAVFGAGTIGLLLLVVARQRGARRIVVTDPLSSKRQRALRMGADAAVDASGPDVVAQVREALGESADVVFDCVAVQSTMDQAVEMALKGGTVVVVGVPSRAVTLPLPVIQDQQVRIQGSATYLPVDYADAISILANGNVDPDDIISGTFDLADAAQAFAAAAGGEHVKILVQTSPPLNDGPHRVGTW